jgi:benzoate/toluate 1,2-dioxygenase beta subunit
MGGSLHKDRVEQLLIKEARYLDHREYEKWLSLYTNDASYWIPSWDSDTETVEDVTNDLSYLFLERPGLEDYVARVRSGEAHVLEPAPRVSRIVTNIYICDEETDTVYCKWMMHLFRRGIEDWFSGEYRYQLRDVEGQLKIVSKKVSVINNLFIHGHFLI